MRRKAQSDRGHFETRCYREDSQKFGTSLQTASNFATPGGLLGFVVLTSPLLTIGPNLGTLLGTMKPSQDIKPVTYLKTRSAEVIQSVSRRRRPLVITQNGVAKVVVQDIKSFERDREALLHLKLLSQGIADVEKGEWVHQEEFFRRIEKKLSPRKSSKIS